MTDVRADGSSNCYVVGVVLATSVKIRKTAFDIETLSVSSSGSILFKLHWFQSQSEAQVLSVGSVRTQTTIWLRGSTSALLILPSIECRTLSEVISLPEQRQAFLQRLAALQTLIQAAS